MNLSGVSARVAGNTLPSLSDHLAHFLMALFYDKKEEWGRFRLDTLHNIVPPYRGYPLYGGTSAVRCPSSATKLAGWDRKYKLIGGRIYTITSLVIVLSCRTWCVRRQRIYHVGC